MFNILPEKSNYDLLNEALFYAFNEYPKENIRKYLELNMYRLGEENFVNTMIYWFGGRGYNQFLDYSLLAIKINKYWTNRYYVQYKEDFDEYETIFNGIISKLLCDDRHDLNQNIPYALKDWLGAFKDSNERFKLINDLAEMLIECFNPAGNEDISTTFKIT